MNLDNDDLRPIIKSPVALALRVGLAIFLIETFYALLLVGYLAINPQASYGYPFIAALWILQTLKFGFLLFVVLKIVMQTTQETVYLHGHHLVVRRRHREQIYELGQLRALDVSQGSLSKRLDYGTIHLVFGAASYSSQLQLLDVESPRYYEAILEKYLHGDSIMSENLDMARPKERHA